MSRKYDALFKKTTGQAVEVFNKDGFHVSVIFGFKKGEIVIISQVDLRRQELAKTMGELREQLIENDCDSYMFINESWMTSNPSVRPSNADDKQEILGILLVSGKYHRFHGHTVKHTQSNGNTINTVDSTPEIEIDSRKKSDDQYSGLFTNLLSSDALELPKTDDAKPVVPDYLPPDIA